MRDYEFRGKRLNSGEWAYGSLTVRLADGYLDHSKKRYYIQYDYMNSYGQVFTDKFEVDPLTIGQFTGLIDKNGKRIHEHDLIKVIGSRSKSHFISEIVWDNDACGFGFQCSKIEGHMDYMDSLPHNKESYSSYYDSCEIIGNIHDKENK